MLLYVPQKSKGANVIVPGWSVRLFLAHFVRSGSRSDLGPFSPISLRVRACVGGGGATAMRLKYRVAMVLGYHLCYA